jgi:hypothetical protein
MKFIGTKGTNFTNRTNAYSFLRYLAAVVGSKHGIPLDFESAPGLLFARVL